MGEYDKEEMGNNSREYNKEGVENISRDRYLRSTGRILGNMIKRSGEIFQRKGNNEGRRIFNGYIRKRAGRLFQGYRKNISQEYHIKVSRIFQGNAIKRTGQIFLENII